MKKVLVIGTRDRLDEFRQLELKNANLAFLDQFYVDLEQVDIPFDEIEKPEDEYYIEGLEVGNYDVVFDLNLDDNPGNLDLYVDNEGQIVIGCAVKQTLAEMIFESAYDLNCEIFGMNALPTFIARPRLELSLYGEEDSLKALMGELGMEYEVVEDRVGMVSPRVVCMIINEACFVLQEGTAGVKAVDQAMKLGTNYPNGPFEWAEKIGLQNVYEVVAALKADTGEEKYKMAPLLKQYHFKNKSFYN
ncbi:MAG: 3-hydroxyacyl-CoA dehydrogenase family protein [Bacteroidota bacterium]